MATDCVHMGQVMTDMIDGNEHANPGGELKYCRFLGILESPGFFLQSDYIRIKDFLY